MASYCPKETFRLLIKKNESETKLATCLFLFSDFDAERNYLHEHVYPLVRQHCRETHGVDFQVSPVLMVPFSKFQLLAC